MVDSQVYSVKDETHITNLSKGYQKSSIHWGAVFAGTLISISLLILFTFLIAGLGLSSVDIESNNPFSGFGAVFNISSAISLALSLALGAYIAGRLAGQNGMIHGFLNWALMTLLTTILSVMALKASTQMASSALTSTFSTAGSVVDNLSDKALNSNSSNLLSSQLEKAKTEIRSALNNTHIDALHTDNLDRAFSLAGNHVKEAFEKLKQKPGKYQEIVSTLMNQLKSDTNIISQNVNRHDIVEELVQRGWQRDEAEKSANKVFNTYNQIKHDISSQLNGFHDFVNNMPKNIDDLKDTAAEKIGDIAGTMQKATLWTFFGGLIGAIISIVAGKFGAERRRFS